MRLLYDIALYIYYLLIRIAALKNPKAQLWLNGRKKQFEAIRDKVSKSDDLVWVHCASLGEFEQGRPLIEAIKTRYPQKKIMLTFYSPSGYEVMKNYKQADYVFYLPLDTYFNAKKFIELTSPKVVFFIKYEYWYNFLRILTKKNIPTYFVSAIFRENQLFFKWYGAWYRKMLKLPNHFFVQNEDSARLLKSLSINNYTISGDTRFDRVASIIANARPLVEVENFVNGNKVIVAGSSWRSEEALLFQYLRLNPDVKAVIAPHEIEESNIQRILAQYGEKAVAFSSINGKSIQHKQVLVIDCYGKLSSIYQYGKIAIIGGGFGVGIHNILEPATFGMPIIFGPNYERFKEAVDLVERNCAFPVNNVEEFNTVLNHLLRNSVTSEKISTLTSDYVALNVGATHKIFDKVFANN